MLMAMCLCLCWLLPLPLKRCESCTRCLCHMLLMLQGNPMLQVEQAGGKRQTSVAESFCKRGLLRMNQRHPQSRHTHHTAAAVKTRFFVKREAEGRAARRAARPSHTEMNTRSKRRLEALSRRYPAKLELRVPQGATPVNLRMQALTAVRFDDICTTSLRTCHLYGDGQQG